MFLLFLFLFLIHHSTIDSTSASSDNSIDLFLGRCTSSKLEAFLLENEFNRVCSDTTSKRAASISIRPTTKREWRIVVKITELMMTNRLSLNFGENLALRFLNKGKVERTIEGETKIIDVDETAQTSTGNEIYDFNLTYSKDLFEIIAVDANLTYNLRGEDEKVEIPEFWKELKLINIHNATASTETQESNGLSIGAIVGITIGALVVFALLCLAARYYFNRRNRLDVTVTHFERADTEKKGMTPPSTPAGGGYIPNKMSRAQNEITGTEITGFTSTASNTGSNASNASNATNGTNGTNGPGRTGFEGQNILVPSIPSPVAFSPK